MSDLLLEPRPLTLTYQSAGWSKCVLDLAQGLNSWCPGKDTLPIHLTYKNNDDVNACQAKLTKNTPVRGQDWIYGVIATSENIHHG